MDENVSIQLGGGALGGGTAKLSRFQEFLKNKSNPAKEPSGSHGNVLTISPVRHSVKVAL
eukprot:gene37870-46003_t